jgi:hypothetical protein
VPSTHKSLDDVVGLQHDVPAFDIAEVSKRLRAEWVARRKNGQATIMDR